MPHGRARVLDLGCGDGVLLAAICIEHAPALRGYGIEIDDANVLACVTERRQRDPDDLESGLTGFEDGSFDT